MNNQISSLIQTKSQEKLLYSSNTVSDVDPLDDSTFSNNQIN